MNEKDLLKNLSDIDRAYIEEAETEGLPRHALLKKPLLIAAALSLMVLLMGSALVTMHLQNLTVDTPPVTDYWGDERNIISLQGFEDSKNYAAFQEWHQFLESYDPDRSILYANNDFYLQMPDAYASYECYSWEMVEKIDEICEKYGLEPLGKAWIFRQPEHIFEAVGIETVFSGTETPEASPFSGYCFNDGTFEMEGALTLSGQWNYTARYNLRSVQKTSFDGVFSSVGDLDTYEQWEYTMADGTKVLLALQDEGRVIVDKEDCFVVVTVFGSSEDIFAPIPHDRAFMEAFCEAFDFSYQTQRVDPDEAYALQCQEAPHTYEAWIEYLLTDEEQSKLHPDLHYALVDINGDGQEELLLRCSGHDFTQQRDGNSFCTATGMRDGELVHFAGHGICYLCEGNVVEYLSPFESAPISHTYERFDGNYKAELADHILYREEDGKLYRQVGGALVEISQAEANAVVAQYPHVELVFQPASEFIKDGAEAP